MVRRMNKLLLVTALSSTLLVSGCDYFKKKKDESSSAMSEWSCTNQSNIDQIQKYLKDQYLQEITNGLASSGYTADQELLQKINNGLKFEITNVRTTTPDPTKTTQLECESQLVVQFPKGLQQRAENAYAEHGGDCRYEECGGEGDGSYRTLREYIEAGGSKLVLNNDQLKGKLNYNIVKTDKDGLNLEVMNQEAVINGIVYVSTKAVQYAAYIAENKDSQARTEADQTESAEQKVLAQKAMDIRKKELDEDKVKQVDRLNQTWDNFTDEQKQKLQQDQSDWFEKRDVDCKVISQKSTYDMSDNEKETYQRQSQYWDDTMRQQNKDMEYTKCFNKRTVERIVYLNNVFN